MGSPNSLIEVQGHRGARGLLPENTLSSFEIALDHGVSSIETDVHLTRDDVPVLFHDARVTSRLCTPRFDRPDPLVRSLTLAELRWYGVGGAAPTPLAQRFAWLRDLHPYSIPTLDDLFAFVADYAGPMGAEIGKTPTQQEAARRLIFDLELKRDVADPQTIDDGFDGATPAMLERRVVAAIRQAGILQRTRVRSFDHRSVRVIQQLEPTLPTALLDEAIPADLSVLLGGASAQLYCPDHRHVDADVVRQVHAAGMRIVPYTANEPNDWDRLLDLGVDGITTDYPDRLLAALQARSARINT